jgi:phosphopantothenoylcysteine decarboxylase/phosphopantothenoylcysteine decarboxylase/phosphopantothenate--cysteine ligase
VKNILLGVSGSIAAYKAADLVGRLTGDGYRVDVIMTKGAAAFLTPLTLQTLSKNRVYTDVFREENPAEVAHIALAEQADLLLVAPASADVIGKMANGIADDMLTSTVLAVRGIPRYIAPAMNTRMYENPAVQENLERLRRFGYEIIPPKEARLACGEVGTGALADVSTLAETVEKRLQNGGDAL